MKVPKIAKNIRVLILIISLVLALIAIHPNPWAEGATVRSVVTNSSASEAGFISPKATATPLSKERIISIDSTPITSEKDYQEYISELKPA
ncbi:MAG: hypothetical protein KAT77_05830, partial [Nanoarchaeota archaeon]|nr:hypothetical protein [Nanoarchaeota archaeon]